MSGAGTHDVAFPFIQRTEGASILDQQINPDSTSTYTNERAGYSITLPEEWVAEPTATASAIRFTTRSPENDALGAALLLRQTPRYNKTFGQYVEDDADLPVADAASLEVDGSFAYQITRATSIETYIDRDANVFLVSTEWNEGASDMLKDLAGRVTAGIDLIPSAE